MNFVEGDLICVSVFFSLVRSEGAAGGGDGTVCLPISELLSAAHGRGLGLALAFLVWGSCDGAGAGEDTAHPGRDGAEHTAQHWNVPWYEVSTGSAPLWLTTNSCPKLLGDGFHSRDGIDGEKVLMRRISILACCTLS